MFYYNNILNFNTLKMSVKKKINSFSKEDIHKIIKVQAMVRGFLYRINNLPNSILFIRKVINDNKIKICKTSSDGRTNSCKDEINIIKLLKKQKDLKKRLFVPKDRHWFDIAVLDYKYGWFPINIKSTTTKTADNVGNLAICAYALTNYPMDYQKSYNNGHISKVFTREIKAKNYNKNYKRDYYFIVYNKEDKTVIANSIRGLQKLTANINNLPFQVKWSDNKKFKYKHINKVVKDIIYCISKPKPSWTEIFLNEVRSIKESIT